MERKSNRFKQKGKCFVCADKGGILTVRSTLDYDTSMGVLIPYDWNTST
jgi:hypothetical protein